jgi:hypothetical protein
MSTKPLPPLGPNERPNLTPAQIEWLLAQPIPMVGPRNFKITVPWKVAKAIRANPDSVRITVKARDGTTMIGERLMELVEVRDHE